MKIKTRTVKPGTTHEVPIWELGYLEVAETEGRKILNEEQYAHVVQLFEDLAYERDPTNSETQDVRKIDEFFELRDKGGILGNINLRIYFTLFTERKMIFILKAYKKEDDDQAPQYIVIGVRNRLRVAKEKLAKNIQKG